VKLKVVMEVDTDNTDGITRPSSALGFTLLKTVLKGQVPTKAHKDVLEQDYGITIVSLEKIP
jgi:hypothetical protein